MKLLSDPTYFPIEFKNWVRTYIQDAGISISRSQITGIGGGGVGAHTGLPAGLLLPCAGSTIPGDTLPCDGGLSSRTDENLLFEVIGTAWGAGDAATTFNRPDLRDRSLYGAGAIVSLAQTDGRALGSRGGPRHFHNLDQTSDGGGSHGHSLSINGVGDHSHSYQYPIGININNGQQASIFVVNNVTGATTGGGGAHSHSGSADAVGNHTHRVAGPTSGGYGQDMPSYAGVIWVITKGH